jgi:hypothetical protein
MKKKFFISVILLFALLTGCTHNLATPKKSPSPAADFQYMENEEGGMTITQYIGTDENVIIPMKIKEKTVTQIGGMAFSHNDTIVSVEIPDSVTRIKYSAFEGCHFLATVSLPHGLESIDDGAFRDCFRLSTVTLPDTLINVGGGSFANCTLLKNINIPKSVIKIYDEAFRNSGIETIDFEEGIKTIEYGAFAHTDIKTVILPKSVSEISSRAFDACANLESITLNEGLTTIGGSAFSGKSKLTEIVVPASVTEIDETAFNGCDTLQAVKFEGNAPGSYQYGYPELIEDANYTVYYHEGATGFTSPEWCGYPTEMW